MQRSLFLLGLLAASLPAQGSGSGPFRNGDYLILCGFAQTGGPAVTGNSFPVSRFKDLDGDGRLDDVAEAFPFLSTSFNTRNGTG